MILLGLELLPYEFASRLFLAVAQESVICGICPPVPYSCQAVLPSLPAEAVMLPT